MALFAGDSGSSKGEGKGDGRRHRSWLVVPVEGIIGAGKSTMLDNLRAVVAETPGPRRYLPVVVPEPLDEVADIRLQFYADPARYGYTFQTAIFVARVQIFRRLLRKALADPTIDEDTTVVFLQDRSSLSDVLFVDNLHLSGAMSPLEYATFRSSWYDFWLDILFGELNAGPDVIVYLRTPLADCMARIAKRAREGEATLPESYQVALQQRHDDRYLGDLVHVTDRASVPCICTTDPDIGISKPKLTGLWTRILDIITGGRDYIDRASLSPQPSFLLLPLSASNSSAEETVQ